MEFTRKTQILLYIQILSVITQIMTFILLIGTQVLAIIILVITRTAGMMMEQLAARMPALPSQTGFAIVLIVMIARSA